MCDLPAALFKTIGRLDHGVSSLNFGISREFWSKFANRGPRDSSDQEVRGKTMWSGLP
jgi:hypothetical protein